MVNHQGISFIAEQVSDITIAETFCKHLLPANDAGSTVLYCMPSIIFHFIFSGKPSSSDGCRSLWKCTFYIWHHLQVEDQILGELSGSLSTWKVILSNCDCFRIMNKPALYILNGCFCITGLECHLRSPVSSWNWYHHSRRSTTWYLGVLGLILLERWYWQTWQLETKLCFYSSHVAGLGMITLILTVYCNLQPWINIVILCFLRFRITLNVPDSWFSWEGGGINSNIYFFISCLCLCSVSKALSS